MFVADALIILIVIYAAYVGTRRGFVLVAAELVGFAVSATIASVLYQDIGRWLVSWAGISLPLANIAAFMAIWMLIEVGFALLVRYTVIPRLSHKVQFSTTNRIGGAIGSMVRALILIALGLIIISGLPFSAETKQPITNAYLSRYILGATASWQRLLGQTLGRDLNSSLTVFTVKADPESTERIQLGFTTTAVKIDAGDEQADLILINHERTSRGLKPLVMNPAAQAVARSYGERMFADGVFSHVDNDGHTPFDRMKAGNVSFGAAGENLALAATLDLAHQGLMNSPGHKANILSTSYNKVGIGVIDGGQYGLMVVQDFTD
ncbi:CvpA family protein [Candidatus Saccharibacteria bacterium]|nr:CvpA family protein [Candidatus Saccharibacteria bacterium]